MEISWEFNPPQAIQDVDEFKGLTSFVVLKVEESASTYNPCQYWVEPQPLGCTLDSLTIKPRLPPHHIVMFFYQLFGLLFWRHPFTAADPLVSKWCEAKFFLICFDEVTNSSTVWMAWGGENFKQIFIFAWTIQPSSVSC